MDLFALGEEIWFVEWVPPESANLLDGQGSKKLAVTDIPERTVYISDDLGGLETQVVLTHEIVHCAIETFGLRDDIRRMARPEYADEAEEWACNLVADYGRLIIERAYDLMGKRAWREMPAQVERLMR